MKENYSRTIKIRCITCGAEDQFEFNEDKSYVKCASCNREYLGGEQELREMNQNLIDESLEDLKNEVSNDLKSDINKMFKDAFRNNKFIKFK